MVSIHVFDKGVDNVVFACLVNVFDVFDKSVRYKCSIKVSVKVLTRVLIKALTTCVGI